MIRSKTKKSYRGLFLFLDWRLDRLLGSLSVSGGGFSYELSFGSLFFSRPFFGAFLCRSFYLSSLTPPCN